MNIDTEYKMNPEENEIGGPNLNFLHRFTVPGNTDIKLGDSGSEDAENSNTSLQRDFH